MGLRKLGRDGWVNLFFLIGSSNMFSQSLVDLQCFFGAVVLAPVPFLVSLVVHLSQMVGLALFWGNGWNLVYKNKEYPGDELTRVDWKIIWNHKHLNGENIALHELLAAFCNYCLLVCIFHEILSAWLSPVLFCAITTLKPLTLPHAMTLCR